jgi:hypothetical protein
VSVRGVSARLAEGCGVSVSAFLTPSTRPAASMIEEASRGHGHFRRLAGLGEEGCFVESDDPRLLLGVFAPDRVRSIVVITTDGELAVAVREAVPAGIAVVRDARPDDAAEAAAACLPWPWMVVGSTDSMTPGLASMLRTRPVLILWLGAAPAGLPGHAQRFDHHSALLEAVDTACTAKVGDMRLALGSGVELGDGTLLRGATLDALIGAYPCGFALPSATFRSVNAALARADAGWSTKRDANACIALVPCTRTAVAQ